MWGGNQFKTDHGPFLTTAVGSVLDDSGTNYGEMECAGDEFDLDNEKGWNECAGNNFELEGKRKK